MKFMLLTLVLSLVFTIKSNAKSDTLIINLKNGKTDSIPVNQIHKIQFEKIVSVQEYNYSTKALSIKGNYPNPFQELTNLEFEIAISGNIIINIYDNLGIHVRKLECTNCQAGRNLVFWDGTDKFNNEVPTGIYYYEVQFNNEIQTKQMLIIK